MESNEQENVYLSFVLAGEHFAVGISKVAEILEVPTITVVPQMPPFMKGIINLRGNVLPVVDTRVKFNLGETPYTATTVIIVLQVQSAEGEFSVGALADSAQEVMEINPAQLKPLPTLGNRLRSEFILGIAEVNQHLVMLLDTDRVFTLEELVGIAAVAELATA